ncbi:hypothetical protein [Methanoregula formicica]|uniref:Uncharacterized protein n=1 Tax=Methanoregula formicica (strain DSM 22288 / NBRC 105244 / SMSP) TaxID=593750 RepID=L0HFT8_METFS|nr:hypothetical protein [Methanoregula formicica]AGB02885.1 hypothetical protein Metfor_1864 [Methanoregula formicica SMSP]
MIKPYIAGAILVLGLLSLCAGPVLAEESPSQEYRDAIRMDDGGFVLVKNAEPREDQAGFGKDIVLERRDRSDSLVWSRWFGGTQDEKVRGITQLSDGGFLIFGQTQSFGQGSWVVRTDAEGREIWNQTFGGRMSDFNTAIEMKGGEYALAGTSDAFSGRGQGAWLVMLSPDGTELWNRTYGGEVLDYATAVAEFPKGGLVLAGVRMTNSDKLEEGLLVRTDSAGNTIWEKTFGGSGSDEIRSVMVTRQDEIVFTGSSFSPGLTIDDFWVVKTDADGNEIWNRKIAGKGIERGMVITPGPDDTFLVGEVVTADEYEIHLLTLDNAGAVLSDKTYTGIEPNLMAGSWRLSRSGDGSLALTGAGNLRGAWALEIAADGYTTNRHLYGMEPAVKRTAAESGSVPVSTYQEPFIPSGWLVRTDSKGKELWNTTFGDGRMQESFALVMTNGGGYAVAGSAVINGMHSDAMLTLFDGSGRQTGQVVLGSDGLAEIHSMEQEPNGGFILAGAHDTSGWESQTMWVVRTDAAGSRQYDNDISAIPRGNGAHVIQSPDGNYVVSGSFHSAEHRSPDGVIVKTGPDGTVFWKRTYGDGGQDGIPWVDRVPGGGYVAVLASTNGGDQATYKSSATLLRLGEDGSGIWSKPLTEDTQVEPRQVLATSDGGFLVAGYAIRGDALVGPWIVKTDRQGTVLWHHVFNFGTLGLKGSQMAVETPDGGYAMTGDKGEDIWLVRFDPSGTELWTATYGGWSQETARGLVATPDGGFTLVGITRSYPVTETAHTERIFPLFVLFTAILAAGLAAALWNERKSNSGKRWT